MIRITRVADEYKDFMLAETIKRQIRQQQVEDTQELFNTEPEKDLKDLFYDNDSDT